jgi:hypothetical protein
MLPNTHTKEHHKCKHVHAHSRTQHTGVHTHTHTCTHTRKHIHTHIPTRIHTHTPQAWASSGGDEGLLTSSLLPRVVSEAGRHLRLGAGRCALDSCSWSSLHWCPEVWPCISVSPTQASAINAHVIVMVWVRVMYGWCGGVM